MRLKLIFTPNTEPVPLNSYHQIKSFVHSCLGDNNDFHDNESDYSLSQVCGGQMSANKMSFDFPTGGFVILTSNDIKFLNGFIGGLNSTKTLGYGMNFHRIDNVQNEIFYDGWNHFRTLSPIIVKRTDERMLKGKDKFSKLTDLDFIEQLTTRMKEKIVGVAKSKKISIDLKNFKVEIRKGISNKVRSIPLQKHKNGETIIITNYGNICPISVFCNKNVAEIIYTYGIGNSCGIGFGSVYKAENYRLYSFKQAVIQ